MECYTKAIRPLLEWLHREYKLDWPSKVIEFIDFLHLVGNKPCSPSFPKRLQQSLAWFEKVGNWDEGERISKHELVNRTVAFWSEELRSGVKPLRQAVRYTWQMMAALELFVMTSLSTLGFEPGQCWSKPGEHCGRMTSNICNQGS